METLLQLFGDDVIVSSATAQGRSALAIVRGSGESVVQIFQKSLKLSPDISNAQGNSAIVVKFCIGELSARAVAVVFRAPKSYTGEDMVELSVHGNPVLVRMILDALIDGGARLAMPGEFTMRATMNGKMNLLEAELVAATISAQTERALVAVRRTTKDAVVIKKAQNEIYETLVELSAALEFSENDEPPDNFSSWHDKITNVKNDLLLFLNRAVKSRSLSGGLSIVIAGEPNAGKSTLFNRIVGAERAIVAPHPGTTRDVIEAMVEISGVPIKILDTAGVRKSAHPVEAEGVRRAQNAAKYADIVLWVVDCSKPNPQSAPMPNAITVLNKSDLGVSEDVAEIFNDAVVISALTGDGFNKLLEQIDKQLAHIPDEAIMASARVENILQKTVDELNIALDAMKKDFWDVAQVCLERADSLIAKITSSDSQRGKDIYDEIFSRFCIGK